MQFTKPTAAEMIEKIKGHRARNVYCSFVQLGETYQN